MNHTLKDFARALQTARDNATEIDRLITSGDVNACTAVENFGVPEDMALPILHCLGYDFRWELKEWINETLAAE